MKKADNIIFIVYDMSENDYNNTYMLADLKQRNIYFEIWLIHGRNIGYLSTDNEYKVDKILHVQYLKEELVKWKEKNTRIIIIPPLVPMMTTVKLYRAISKSKLKYGALSHDPFAQENIPDLHKKLMGALHFELTFSSLIYDISIANTWKKKKQIMYNLALKFPILLGIRTMDFIIVSGTKSEECNFQFPTSKKTKRILAHCKDTEKSFLESTEISEEICVYLDTNLFFDKGGISDKTKEKLRNNAEKYGKKCCQFFDYIERELGISVVISVHPRLTESEIAFIKNLYGNRMCIKNKTTSLVKQSKLVLCVITNSIKSAVIANKSIQPIMTEELYDTDFELPIIEQAAILDKNIIKIDEIDKLDISDILYKNEGKYKEIIEKFCVQKLNDKRLFWEKVLDDI